MRRPLIQFRRLTALALLACTVLASAIAAQPDALKPFTATYHTSYLGLPGTGTMTLVPLDGDRWRYSLDIDSAIANASQSTVFDANGGQWRPLSNLDTTKLLFKKKGKQATYDWQAGQARWSGDVKADRAGPVPLRAGDLDAMLINLAIPRDLAAGKPLDYHMVDNGRAKQLRYQVAGTETIEVGGQSRNATKVSRSDGDKQVTLWVVDGLPVPARILQRKDGKDEMELTLQSIR